jgi:glycosyltransferase involved in cell wall biosynthesis
MVIGIDIRVLARGTRTGVEEYTLNLLAHLLGLDQSIQYKLFYNAYQKIELDYSWLKLPNVQLYDFRIPNRFLFVAACYLHQPKIDRLLKGIDVYFNPHFFVAPLSKKCQKVITFHDLSFEHYPEFFSWRKRAWQKFLMNTRQEAREADKIIAVSQSTRDDLVNLYGIKPEKIKVIYSGVGREFQSQKPKAKSQNHKSKLKSIKIKYNLPEKFILYFGTIEPRKNLIGLIRAFELLNTKYERRNTKYKLVIAGAKGWLYQDILKAAKESKYSQDIIFTGFIEEQDKPALYNLAELFVYPSFFEGFGFPPLEAMAGGVPTIVSHTSSLPEVVGDAAIMIDPYNIDELAWAIEMVLQDKDLRQRLERRGIEQARKFSWQRCAEETLEILKDN